MKKTLSKSGRQMELEHHLLELHDIRRLIKQLCIELHFIAQINLLKK